MAGVKVIRLPHANGGEAWAVTHDLMVADGRRRRLRPIHVFTHLAQHLYPLKPGVVFGLAMALENKLYSVRFHHFELRRAIAAVDDPIYRGAYIREYEDEQRAIAALEAYLGAIYTSLEIVAQINRLIHDGLPMGFRKQAKKAAVFNFADWPWLPHFFDVRSELTHFNTPLPLVQHGCILIDFQRTKELEVFPKGRAEVELKAVLAYATELFRMLDAWAVDELKRVDPNTELHEAVELGPNTPLKVRKITARRVLKLLRDPKPRATRTAGA